MALNKSDLDRVASQGCQVRGCDHSQHEGQVYLHSRCHMEAQVTAAYCSPADIKEVQVACAGCGAFVCRVKVKEVMPLKKCHDTPVEVEYTKGSGVLNVKCNQCKELIAAIPVAD